MRYRNLGMLAVLASLSGAAWAEMSPAPATVPTMQLNPPRTVAQQGMVRHWHVPPRPHGWVWGRPGWWGGSYQLPVRGYILPSFWMGAPYAVSDWAGYGFTEPGRGRHWVRYYNDAVLVDERGLIHESVHDVPWGRYTHGPVPAYVGDAPDARPGYGAGYDYGYDDEVTWSGGSSRSDRQIWAWPSNAASSNGNTVIVVPPGSITTITFHPQQVVTTTVSDYEPVDRPVWKAAPRAKEQPRSSTPPRVIGRVPVKKS